MARLKLKWLERKIGHVIVALDQDLTPEIEYKVGKAGVTAITVVEINGEMAAVPFFHIWKGDDLSATISVHNVNEWRYLVPNEPYDQDELPF